VAGMKTMDSFCVDLPELSEWECHLFGMEKQIVFRPLKGNEPNWFWRAMQFYIFGNRWVKVKNEH
jgi:hypothetical protein